MPISYEPLNERLSQIGARADCVMCGHNKWAGFGLDQISLGFVPMLDEVDKWIPGRGFTAAGWVCSNCGFVRLHALDVPSREAE
jgi:hypothetical protein